MGLSKGTREWLVRLGFSEQEIESKLAEYDQLSPEAQARNVDLMNKAMDRLHDYVSERVARGWDFIDATLRKREGAYFGHIIAVYEGKIKDYEFGLGIGEGQEVVTDANRRCVTR